MRIKWKNTTQATQDVAVALIEKVDRANTLLEVKRVGLNTSELRTELDGALTLLRELEIMVEMEKIIQVSR